MLKKMFKNVVSALLIAAISMGFAGCGPKKGSTDDKVKLVWVMPGEGSLKDYEMVWAEFNKKLQEKMPNVEVVFQTFAPADYQQKVLLMQTSHEKMDILNTAYLKFGDEVKNGSFLAIDEQIEKYAGDLKEMLPEGIFDYMKVDGKIYGIPSYQGLVTRKGIYTPKALADKYLDKEGLKAALDNNETLTEDFYVVMEEYLKKMKENGELRLGFKSGFDAKYAFKGYDALYDSFVYNKYDEDCKIEWIQETPEMKMYFSKVADWYKKGYIRKDILVNSNDVAQVGKENGYITWVATDLFNSGAQATKQYGFDIEAYPLEKDYWVGITNSGAGGNAISINSEHPDEAVEFLCLLNTDEELWRLLCYGIEGKHYEIVDGDAINTFGYTGIPTSTSSYGMYNFCLGNTFLGYRGVTTDPDYLKELDRVSRESQFQSPLKGFVLNIDNAALKSKASQIAAVEGEYLTGLLTGALDDPEKVYAEFIEKAKKAGLDDVKAEIQRQVDEFLASKNK